MTKERELLRRAHTGIKFGFGFAENRRKFLRDVEEFLAAEPEAEPVGWLASYPENPDLGNWFCHTNFADYEGVKCEPLYLHPPRPEPEAEPIYLARRKGLDDFFTCSKDRYNELSVLDLFETKIAYLQPPRPEPARKPWQGLDEDEIEEILEGFPMGTYSEQAFAQAIEQALKEKNT